MLNSSLWRQELWQCAYLSTRHKVRWPLANSGQNFVYCLLPLDNPHYEMPMNNRPSRSEPEIIPPGFDEHSRRKAAGMWVRIDERDGVLRPGDAPPPIPDDAIPF